MHNKYSNYKHESPQVMVIKAGANLAYSNNQNAFTQYINEFKMPSTPATRDIIKERIHWAHKKYGGNLVLGSSFGPQSILLISAIIEANINIPVVMVDIENSAHNKQREYRDLLHRELNFDLRVFSAKNEAEKAEAMTRGLKSIGATAIMSGIREDQTGIRANKDFIEQKNDGTIALYPILDWPKAKVEYYLEEIDSSLRRHDITDVDASHGGVKLEAGEEKMECGLHFEA